MRCGWDSAIFAHGRRALKKPAHLVCLVTVACLGCKPPAPHERLDTVGSWLATAQLTAQAWLNHTTPDKYTTRTLSLSHDTIEQTGADLLASTPAGVDSAALDSLLARSARHVARMKELVAGRNAPGLRLQVDSVRGDEKQVRQLAERVKSKQ